ncbi:hypothetical protein AWM75_02435 [Aerococcus urinaehominis]|uniref:Penicillin-binding protein n=1 Tax=Aerococcus urinaehominis TaxID=128944 RepID=A0A109RHP5_9LACT|nr:penicillin-binding transpeptidase domain-containing protein [Aerococcus urinaehominis]AMB98920.1 hypothetical protein AWM75_02435 [Aerococcus urinaehominis]
MNQPIPPKRRSAHWERYLGRFNLLLAIIACLFIILVLRLGYLQIVEGQAFQDLVQLTERNIAKESVPRGRILDRNGQVLVDNEALQAISYTRGPNVSGEDMVKTANKLAELINMSTDDLEDRDLKDYWAAANMETLNDRLDEDEKHLNGGELYQAQLDHISDQDLQFSDKEKQAAAIYKRMNSAYALSTTFIKNRDVTDEEIARVGEYASILPGVHASTDWRRSYPKGSLLRSILGSVSSNREGLPSETADAYLAQGYARNDRVGTSYLEQQYEPLLSGSKAILETEINPNGEVVDTKQLYSGKMGDTLELTIDTDLQERLEAIAEDYLRTRSYAGNNEIYMIATNPQNGDVLSMVGKHRTSSGDIQDNALGTINSSFAMGSSVKGATVAAGYYYDVISTEDNVITDEPLYFEGTPLKASWWYTYNNDSRPRDLNDINALAESSNIYMIKLAMEIGGLNYYEPGMDLGGLYQNLYNKLRYVYAQFGLGVETGIDLPQEGTGFNGGIGDNPGNALDLSFGQFDTYTPMQLAQYVATIANNGVRIAPHLLKEVREENHDETPGQVLYLAQPQVLNRVTISQEELARIQAGFHANVNRSNGLAYSQYQGFNVEVAGKSGTAELGEVGLENSTFVGYAPYNNPEIAIAIVIPNINTKVQESSAQVLSRSVFDAYFNRGPVQVASGETEANANQSADETEEVAGTEVSD